MPTVRLAIQATTGTLKSLLAAVAMPAAPAAQADEAGRFVFWPYYNGHAAVRAPNEDGSHVFGPALSCGGAGSRALDLEIDEKNLPRRVGDGYLICELR